jgi:hypothetical protein
MKVMFQVSYFNNWAAKVALSAVCVFFASESVFAQSTKVIVAKDGTGDLSEASVINSVEPLEELPQVYALSQNYPNPFNPSTQIQYALPEAAQVSLEVFNAAGQKVATLVDTHQPAGYHTATFDASQLSSGVYLYKLTTPGFSQTKKMLLIK